MATSVSRKRKLDTEDDELLALLSEQRRELTDAIAADSDLDFAFQLQMEEAIKVSLTSQPSSSQSSSQQPSLLLNEVANAPSGIAHLVAEEIDRFDRERSDRELVEAESRNMQENLNRMIHDQIFAREIQDVSPDEWRETGDIIEKPYGILPSSNQEAFRVYFKGLVSDETVLNAKMPFAGIGVAICDSNDRCVFELSKPYLLGETETEGEGDLLELKALIEALNTAVTLGLRRVHVFCDSNSVYQYLTGKGRPINKIVPLTNQVNAIQTKFAHCSPYLVKEYDVKFAFQFAIDAIVSEATKMAENTSGKTLVEQCTICFESTYIAQMFTINKCQHRYCFSCMRKHVEAKLHQGKLPECPHEGCKSELKIEACKRFLDRKVYDIMNSLVKEASIPPSEKVYCPFSNCSALMSKSEVDAGKSLIPGRVAGMRKCVKCHRLFCIVCKVPWHDKVTCADFSQPSNEAKLKSLAKRENWRRCAKCKNMVELATGCYHITCRCGHEFCYTCGAEWIKKKATCKCPLWDEPNIMYRQRQR